MGDLTDTGWEGCGKTSDNSEERQCARLCTIYVSMVVLALKEATRHMHSDDPVNIA